MRAGSMYISLEILINLTFQHSSEICRNPEIFSWITSKPDVTFILWGTQENIRDLERQTTFPKSEIEKRMCVFLRTALTPFRLNADDRGILSPPPAVIFDTRAFPVCAHIMAKKQFMSKITIL